jgi:SAM-dependent methyltransferase
MTSPSTHWEAIYGHKRVDEVSWYRPHLERSLDFVERTHLSTDAALIDVGAGASTLVDDLLQRGYRHLTALDVSAKALEVVRGRLGPAGASVRWVVADVTRAELPRHAFDFWHDRAVFHFLCEEEERRRYVELVRHAVKPGGQVMVATFGPEGPAQCSGLEVRRYSDEALHAEFGADFRLEASLTEVHHTPGGKPQQFVYCSCRLAA